MWENKRNESIMVWLSDDIERGLNSIERIEKSQNDADSLL